MSYGIKKCNCEHWQQCPVCMPHRFDADGNLKPPEPTPLEAARAEAEKWKEEARRYAQNAEYWRPRCVSCGGALPATGKNNRTGECVCGEPTALKTVHRMDGPCYATEPVAWMIYTLNGKSVCITDNPEDFTDTHRALPLYTAPPQRKPLTDEEIQELSQHHKFDSRMVKFVRIIERAHGIGT